MSYDFDSEEVPNKFPQRILDTLLGGTYEFYGVDGHSFCIGVNGARMVLEAVEDPGDGYRSYFGCFKTSEVGKIFFREPIALVRFKTGGLSTRCDWMWARESEEEISEEVSTQKSREAFSGWVLEDAQYSHTWLTIGTDYGEDYYPCFTFRYSPRDKDATLRK